MRVNTKGPAMHYFFRNKKGRGYREHPQRISMEDPVMQNGKFKTKNIEKETKK